jgi:hypothetical protein
MHEMCLSGSEGGAPEMAFLPLSQPRVSTLGTGPLKNPPCRGGRIDGWLLLGCVLKMKMNIRRRRLLPSFPAVARPMADTAGRIAGRAVPKGFTLG